MSREELEPHWQDQWPVKPPPPMPPRCLNCGTEWPKAGNVCDPKCAAARAERIASFAIGSCTTEEHDAAEMVEAAMTKAADAAAERERYRTGRD